MNESDEELMRRLYHAYGFHQGSMETPGDVGRLDKLFEKAGKAIAHNEKVINRLREPIKD